MRKHAKIVAARITSNTAKILDEYCKRNTHMNTSDFIRDAIREKIQRDAPELYHKLFKETEQ